MKDRGSIEMILFIFNNTNTIINRIKFSLSFIKVPPPCDVSNLVENGLIGPEMWFHLKLGDDMPNVQFWLWYL